MTESTYWPEEIWILDQDQDRLKTWISPEASPLKDLFAEYSLKGFSTVETTEEALNALGDGRRIGMVVTDSLGFHYGSVGRPLLLNLHETIPLAMVALFSNTPNERLASLKRINVDPSALVHASCVRSEGPERLVAVLLRWKVRMQLPAARRIHEYLDKNSRQDFAFFEDGHGAYMSYTDIHREIVNGTSLGTELERTVLALPDNCFVANR